MRLGVVCLTLLLTACKADLYGQLGEVEANRMLALLLFHQIPAEKVRDKEGYLLRVDPSRFVEAEELLRQSGMPHRQRVGIADLFPAGQLVSSPEQEAAKLRFIKGQEMENLLSRIEGVISADVSVAESVAREGEPATSASAAVYIQYSPAFNLAPREAELRALVSHGIPGLSPEQVSLVMQQADLPLTDPPPPAWRERVLLWGGVGGVLSVVLALTGWWFWRKRR
ncbi:hypothetical protein THUN1379_26680 [Paludibacterium sp. THUN1379]|nr:hypothetical protein THUN1379_26680 [Paludibacterium sp. THUN1379]